jgi:hypothetical protein
VLVVNICSTCFGFRVQHVFYSFAFDYNFFVNVKTGGFLLGPAEEIAVLIAFLRDNRAGSATHHPEQEEHP